MNNDYIITITEMYWCVTCKEEGIKKRATFGDKETRILEYCSKHKNPEHIDLVSKRCKECDNPASYVKPGSKTREYCKLHKPIDYVFSRKKICIHKDCNLTAFYFKPNTKINGYCTEHKQDGYISNSIKCIVCNKTKSTFNLPGETKGLYCKKCKPNEQYVDVISSKCITCNKKRSKFNLPEETKGLYCKKCKPNEHYIDVVNRRCLLCYKHSSYGKPGSKIPEYCAKHKPIDYVNVISTMCIEPDCKTQACFGKPNCKAEFCSKHKKEGYINVHDKICEHKGCETQAGYGKLFQQSIHCAKHKSNNEYLKQHPTCKHQGCKSIPCYTNQDDNFPLRCEKHKEEEDVSVILRKCDGCGLDWIIKLGNVCNDCGLYNKNTRIKHKELEVKNVLDNNDFKYDSYDKPIKGGKSKKRPDFVFYFEEYIVILEVDEQQHRTYELLCEQARMREIYNDIKKSKKNKPMKVLIIRYNPDSYKNSEGKTVRASVSRHTRLVDTLNSIIHCTPKFKLGAIYLFYDGDNGVNEEIEVKLT